MDKVARKDLATQMLKPLDSVELTDHEMAEIALNVFGFVAQECGMTLHDAIGAVMSYYKANADR